MIIMMSVAGEMKGLLPNMMIEGHSHPLEWITDKIVGRATGNDKIITGLWRENLRRPLRSFLFLALVRHKRITQVARQPAPALMLKGRGEEIDYHL